MQTEKSLTFAEFQATGQATADLRDTCPSIFDRRDYPNPVPGRHYCGEHSLYIECANDTTKGEFITEVANFAVQGTLAECEVELYAFYVCECTDDDVRVALHDAAPVSQYWPREADTEETLCTLAAAWCSLNGLEHQSADEMLHNHELTGPQRAWLGVFTERWDAVMDAEDNDRANDQREADEALNPINPRRPDEEADDENELSAAELLVHAYENGEARGGSVDWGDVNAAWQKAVAELGPDRVAEIRACYIEDGDEDEDEDA